MFGVGGGKREEGRGDVALLLYRLLRTEERCEGRVRGVLEKVFTVGIASNAGIVGEAEMVDEVVIVDEAGSVVEEVGIVDEIEIGLVAEIGTVDEAGVGDETVAVAEVATTVDEVGAVDKVVALNEVVTVLEVATFDEETILAEAVTVTVTVKVMALAVTLFFTTMVDVEPVTVEVALTVVVDGVIEKQEQAVEIADEAKAVRYEGIGTSLLRFAWVTAVAVVVAVTDLRDMISVMMIGNIEKQDVHFWRDRDCGCYCNRLGR